MGYRTQHSRYPSNVQEQTPSSPGLLQRLFCRLRRRREEEKVGTPHPPQGGCRPLDPRLADGIPDFATALPSSQGFSKVVFSSRTARKRAVREEGAGGGRSPPPAPSSPCERRRREESKRAATFEKPSIFKTSIKNAVRYILTALLVNSKGY